MPKDRVLMAKCGMNDVVLIWVHDNIERNDAAVYYPDDHDFGVVPAIDLVRFADLQPDWSAPGAREPGTMRWSVQWARNETIRIGMTVVEPGHRVPAAALTLDRLLPVTQGQASTDIGAGTTARDHLDGLHVPAGETAALRNNGRAVLRLLWVDSPV